MEFTINGSCSQAHFDWGFISYAPMTFDGHTETALYNEETDKWYILEGDHREGYSAIGKTDFESCLEYYRRMSELREYQSPYTTGD